MRLLPVLCAVAVAVPTFGVSHVSAQEVRRPSRALFGDSSAGTFGQSLTTTGSAGAGYDTDVRQNAVEAGFDRPAVGRGGSVYSLFSGGLRYSVNTSSVSVGMSGSASRRYYPSASSSAVSSYSGGVGATFAPSTRTSFNVDQTFTYQPFSVYSLFPQADPQPLGEPLTPDLDYYTTTQGYLSYYTSAGFSHRFSRWSTLSGMYSRQSSDMPGTVGSFVSQTGSARFTRSLTKGFGLRLGYGYTGANYGNTPDLLSYHYLDTGADYNKSLSFSRRTTFSFSTGGSAYTAGEGLEFTVIGNATLRHEIGRTWDLTAGYVRNVTFLEGFGAPLEYQSLNVQLGGLFSRRFSFHSGAGSTAGRFAGTPDGAGQGFDNIYASTGLGTAINRYLNVSVDYSYYWYAFGRAVVVPGGLTSERGRHAVHASIDAWAPLFERGRRRDAAR